MKEFIKSEISIKTSRIALIIFAILAGLLCLYRFKTYTYVTVEFKETRPVRNKIPVYLKGYRIGKVEKIIPSEDFQTTKVTIVLFPKKLKLPSNTTAILTREKRDRKEVDFINLVYPESPSKVYLENGDIIQGSSTVDIESFFSKKALSGELDAITGNVNKLLESLQSTSEALTQLMEILSDTVNENRPSIKIMTNNLAQASNNLRMFSLKINNSVSNNQMKDTFKNIDNTTKNITTTTQNVSNISQNIEDITTEIDKKLPQISNSISNTELIAYNLAIITGGLKNTMSKNFGGLRLLFGKPINIPKCKKTCN